MRSSNDAPPIGAGRVPPHDQDAEMAVLSAVLGEPDALDRVLETLEADHFYVEAHRRIYEACVELARESKPIDIVTVAARLREREQLQRVGGSPYLMQLVDTVPAVAHIGAYAAIVREKWRVRRLISTCQRIAAEGYGDIGEAQRFIDGAEQAVYELARTPETSTVHRLRPILHNVFERIQERMKRGGRITGTATGFTRLDAQMAGLHAGELTIVAARPGMGKTSFVLNVAVNVAAPTQEVDEGDPSGVRVVPGLGVAVFSLEMPREQLVSRMICSEARVDVSKLRQGFLGAQDWNALTSAAAFLNPLPIWIDDTPALGVLELRAKVRRLQAECARGGAGTDAIGLIVIDYLQLMRGSPNAQSREQEISEISRSLKQLSKELAVPVIALSQLNRAVETRTTKDKRPQLSDLRESGAIEQDADNIIFIYRDDYYNRETSDRPGVAELIVAKQRNGPTGRINVRFDAAYTRFDNLAPGEHEDQPE